MSPSALREAWLVRVSGTGSPARVLLRGDVIRIGRDPSNDVVLEGSTVSSRHCQIRFDGLAYRVYDSGSTNGTYVDGRRVEQALLMPHAEIRFGAVGPRYAFEVEHVAASADLDKTVVFSESQLRREEQDQPISVRAPDVSVDHHDEKLLSAAVEKAREARRMGRLDQTQTIMREMLGMAKGRAGKRFKIAIGVLAAALVAVSGLGYWKVQEKTDLDRQIEGIEERLASGQLDQAEIDRLMERLDEHQREAQALQSGLLFRWGILGEEQLFIQREVRTLLKEFGAEAYSIPPGFIEQVERFIERYQTSDRAHVERVMGKSRAELERMREIFVEEKLPPDLAYMVLVESAFLAGSYSRAGAAGPWQFRAATARQYGLTVTQEVDERYDLDKSTRAAAAYIRRLILDFGAGSSAMLALAAYNVGPSEVKRAVRKIEDPIKQRNFWYLYRVRALPAETREYVPKIIAAIIVGRYPERFGFGAADSVPVAAATP
ncbi:MAG: FHA domain-containing protein [Acidobacteria bacterium]|nr:FHA domain-containing protein [Acidobacteriota bacterium]